jgi:hypothetical protein
VTSLGERWPEKPSIESGAAKVHLGVFDSLVRENVYDKNHDGYRERLAGN